MVSTRKKSYQPTPPATPEPGASGPTSRLRHNSLSNPPVAASPRRSRRASSLTPLEAESSSAEAAQARGHRTKALLERYRSEAAGKLKVVEEEAAPATKMAKAGRNGGEPAEAEADPAAAAESVPAEATLTPSVSVETAPAPAKQDVEEASEDEAHSESVEGPVSQEAEKEEGSPATAMEVDDEEEVDVEEVEGKSAEQKAAEGAARRVAAAQRVLASVTKVTASSPAATPARAPTAAATDAPALTGIWPAPKPRGIAKSGRFWKSVRTRASKVLVRDPVSYEERMQKRKQQQVVKDLENQLKNERKQKLEDLRKRREYNTKKAAENALKAEVYQVVKNPNKIKRMKKKQLRLLQKRDTTVVGKSVLDE